MLNDLKRWFAGLTKWIARDQWFGIDKLNHFAWSGAFWLALAALVTSGQSRLLLFAIGAVGVEVVQLIRFVIWVRKGRPQPYPAFADGFSYRDLAWDVLGAVAAAGAIARVVMRALLMVVVLIVGASTLSAQKNEKAPAFDLRGVTFDSTIYGQDVPMYLPPMHGFVLQAPAGDVFVVLNGVRADTVIAASGGACGPAVTNQPAAAIARLVLGTRDTVWWSQDFLQRGQSRFYEHWTQLLPSGDTLRLTEVWRRRTECASSDGSLIVVFSFRRGRR